MSNKGKKWKKAAERMEIKGKYDDMKLLLFLTHTISEFRNHARK